MLSASLSLSCRGDRLVSDVGIPKETYPENNVYWGFMNPKGDVAISAHFHEVRDFHNGLAAFRKGYLWGYLDKSGQEVIKPTYLQAYTFSNNLARVITTNGRTLFINPSGKSAFDLRCTKAGNFNNNLANIWQNGKVGYINTSGQVVITPRYDDGFDFNFGVTTVKVKQKYGLIDKNGQYLLEPKYDFIYCDQNATEPICLFRINDRVGYYDIAKRQLLTKRFSDGQPFYHHTAVVQKDSLFGVINQNGQWIVAPIFSELLNLGENRWTLFFDNQYFMIDSSGLQHGEGFHQIYRFSEKLARAQIDKKWGFIDPSGEFIIAPIYHLVWPFKNGIARVASDSGIGYIDTLGNYVLPPQQADIRDFHDELARFNVPK